MKTVETKDVTPVVNKQLHDLENLRFAIVLDEEQLRNQAPSRRVYSVFKYKSTAENICADPNYYGPGFKVVEIVSDYL